VLTAMRHQRGFTLIELLVALVMMGIVTGGLYAMLIRTQRLTRAQTEQLDLQSNVRTASLVIPSELRELNTVVGALSPDQVDVLDNQLTSVTYRAMRGFGLVCQATNTEIRLLRSTWSGYRDPAIPRDGAYIFVENDPDKSTDDVWLKTSIIGVANSTCGAAPAIALTVPLLASTPGVGTPVRMFEVMKLSLYAADGRSWLGAQSISGGDLGPQPLLGPLRDVNGLGLKYLDATGAQTAVLANIKSIVLTVRGVSSNTMSKGGGSSAAQGSDSLVTLVSLRNAFR
jgi:prepilin-type N-terminal cleavage/methylation domain-containing protein